MEAPLKALILAALLAMLMVLPASAAARAEPAVRFVVYGTESCPFCNRLLAFLREEFGKDLVVFHDIRNSTNAKLYRELTSMLGMGRYVPVTGLVVNGTVVAVVQGAVLDRGYWLSLIGRQGDGVFVRKVVPGVGRVEEVTDVPQGRLLELLQLAKPGALGGVAGRANVGWTLLTLAVVDSVNPCAMAFMALVASVAATLPRLRGFLLCAAFVAGVYVSYTMVGLGLLSAAAASSKLALAVAAVGMGLGGYEVARWAATRRCPTCELAGSNLLRSVARRLNRGSAAVAFLAGAAITLTFMMCSAAPYFVAVSLISEVVEGAARLLYILAYNVVVILPLAAVALGAVKLSDALASRGHVHLLRGAVLMAAGAYALHAFF